MCAGAQHTLYETLGSVAFALELLQANRIGQTSTEASRQDAEDHAGANDGVGRGGHYGTRKLVRTVPSLWPVRLLENLCIPADGAQTYMNMKSRTCFDGVFGTGPASFIVALMKFLGVELAQLQHYPCEEPFVLSLCAFLSMPSHNHVRAVSMRCHYVAT